MIHKDILKYVDLIEEMLDDYEHPDRHDNFDIDKMRQYLQSIRINSNEMPDELFNKLIGNNELTFTFMGSEYKIENYSVQDLSVNPLRQNMFVMSPNTAISRTYEINLVLYSNKIEQRHLPPTQTQSLP